MYVPKLVELDCTALVGVKHSYHHLHRMRVEARVVSIHQRGSELLLRQLSRTGFVDGFEKRKEGGILAALGRWRRCWRWARERRRTTMVLLRRRAETVILRWG